MTDRTMKALLFAIAVALWAQLLTPWVTTPARAQQGPSLPAMRQGSLPPYMSSAAPSPYENPAFWLRLIANGECHNRKLC